MRHISPFYFIDRMYANQYIPHLKAIINGGEANLSKSDFQNARLDFEPVIEDGVAIYRVDGVITKDDQFCGPLGTKSLMQSFTAFDESAEVKSHLFLIDSPGGEGSYLKELSDLIAQSDKPSLALCSGVCSSAAYYIASACDEIWASSEDVVFGSVGSYIPLYDYKEMLEKEGIKYSEVYATLSTEKNRPWREFDEKGDDRLIKEIYLDPSNKIFIETVCKNRRTAQSFDPSKVQNGQVYYTRKAIDVGLCDRIGNFQSALVHLNTGKANQQPSKSNKHQKMNKKFVEEFQKKMNVLNEAFRRLVSNNSLNESEVNRFENDLSQLKTLFTQEQNNQLEAQSLTEEVESLQELLKLKNDELNQMQLEVGQAKQDIGRLESTIRTLNEGIKTSVQLPVYAEKPPADEPANSNELKTAQLNNLVNQLLKN